MNENHGVDRDTELEFCPWSVKPLTMQELIDTTTQMAAWEMQHIRSAPLAWKPIVTSELMTEICRETVALKATKEHVVDFENQFAWYVGIRMRRFGFHRVNLTQQGRETRHAWVFGRRRAGRVSMQFRNEMVTAQGTVNRAKGQ